jgi:hypothetical protein
MTRKLPRCKLPGCPRTTRAHEYCSGLCSFVATELEITDRLIGVVGEVPTLQLAAKSLADALVEFRTEFVKVRTAAREVGMTDEQWAAVLRGASNAL